jgi:queuosine precursor transporter
VTPTGSHRFGDLRALAWPVLAMTLVVVASNVLVQYPFTPWGLQDYLTWGAFTYPVSFLVTDLTNRRYGVGIARRLVAIGFVVAVLLSMALATPRIAFASGTAFLVGQMLDVTVFNGLRRQAWWRAPLIGSLIGSALDTALFFSLAFAGSVTDTAIYPFGIVAPVWVGWALSDFAVKVAMAFLMLAPYGALLRMVQPTENAAKTPAR